MSDVLTSVVGSGQYAKCYRHNGEIIKIAKNGESTEEEEAVLALVAAAARDAGRLASPAPPSTGQRGGGGFFARIFGCCNGHSVGVTRTRSTVAGRRDGDVRRYMCVLLGTTEVRTEASVAASRRPGSTSTDLLHGIRLTLAPGVPAPAARAAGLPAPSPDVSLDREAAATLTSVLSDVATALAFLHSIGVVHADVKGANIVVNVLQAGGPGLLGEVVGSPVEARLVDFGTAFVLPAPGVAGSQEPVGTPGWMAPELSDVSDDGTCTVTPGLDHWSLGATAWELTVGAPPFGTGLAAIYAAADADAVAALHTNHPFGKDTGDLPQHVLALLAFAPADRVPFPLLDE